MGIKAEYYDPRRTERVVPPGEGEVLATLGRKFMRHRLPFALGLCAGGLVMIQAVVRSRVAGTGGEVLAPMTGGTLLLLFGLLVFFVIWSEKMGGRDRLLVLVDGELWVRRTLRWDHVPWDRIEYVTPMEAPREKMMVRWLTWNPTVEIGTYTHPRAFSLRGTNDDDGVVGNIFLERYLAEELDVVHERLLHELGERFGHVEVDCWDAAVHAKGTPAATAERRRKERERLEQQMIDQGLDPGSIDPR